MELYIVVTTKIKRTIGYHSKPQTFIWNMAIKTCRHVMFFSQKFSCFSFSIDALVLWEFFYVLFNLVNNFFLLFLLGFVSLLLYFFAKIVVGLIIPIRYY